MISSRLMRRPAAATRVVEFVRRGIEGGTLKPGDRLPAERDLALAVGVSRPSLRSGLRALQAMGVIRCRQGSRSYVTEGPPHLSNAPLKFLAALHGIGSREIFEARQALEVAAAALAAERARPAEVAAMAEEVASMFAALEDPHEYLLHDVQFHRTIAAASGNRVLSTLIDVVSELVYEDRRRTAERTTDLRESAEMHRRVYRAIRSGDAGEARREMSAHLELARAAQEREPEPRGGSGEPRTGAGSAGPDEGRGDRHARGLPGAPGGGAAAGAEGLRRPLRRRPAQRRAARD